MRIFGHLAWEHLFSRFFGHEAPVVEPRGIPSVLTSFNAGLVAKLVSMIRPYENFIDGIAFSGVQNSRFSIRMPSLEYLSLGLQTFR